MMNTLLKTTIKISFAAALVLCCVCVPARAQALNGGSGSVGRVQLDSLDRVASKAAESANVNLSEQLLKIVPPLLSKKDPEEKNVGELIAGLRGIYVKHFEFDAEGVYTESDIAPIRAQLSGAGWTRIVEVHSRREEVKNIEVYLNTSGSRVEGLVVIAAAPKELTIVNLVGTVDLDKLRRIEGNFGVPELDIERDETKAPKKTGSAAATKPTLKP